MTMMIMIMMRLSVIITLALFLPAVVSGFASTVSKKPTSTYSSVGVGEQRQSLFLKPWPEPVVISNGDYRDELFLEQNIGGPLYETQKDILRFPVPSLEDTVERLIPTAIPLAESDEEKQAFLKACEDFPSQASALQKELLQRKQDNDAADSSWLQKWWQKYGYLTYRDPVAVFVSYFLLIGDDNKLPKKGDDDDSSAGLARAAAAVYAVAEGRKQICSGQMTPESVGAQPLCSVGFKYMFHACRLPQPEQDSYAMYDPSLYRHCIVASNGQFYAVDIVDDNDDPLPLSMIEARLKRCQELSHSDEQKDYPQLGWLTSSDRDTWTNDRNELLNVGGDTMQDALQKLESGAFVINLDDDEPDNLTDACNEFWTGGDKSGGNRWFDKSMQLLCSKNGKIAYLGEHSMLDAAPTIAVIRRILKSTYSRLAKKQKSDEDNLSEDEINAGVTNIFEPCWSSDPKLLDTASQLSAAAKDRHYKLTHDYELKTVHFKGFGKKYVKQADFTGPEFAQMAIQLASYRLLGTLVGTYEAALARYFLHGRTETSRPVSPATLAFCEAMNDDKSKEDKLNLLKEATSTFIEYQNNASSGKGVDRHLFGLSCLLSEDGSSDDDSSPSLFSDPLFQRSKTFRLSTSSVIFCPGFGPVAANGLGVGFQVDKDSFIYICTARKEDDYIPKFTKLLEEALVEMGDLLKEEE